MGCCERQRQDALHWEDTALFRLERERGNPLIGAAGRESPPGVVLTLCPPSHLWGSAWRRLRLRLLSL